MWSLKPKVQQIQLDVISYPGGMRCTYAHQYAGNDMHIYIYIYICRQAYAETLGPTCLERQVLLCMCLAQHQLKVATDNATITT